MASYLCNPQEIYRRSFDIVREESALDDLPSGIADIAVTCAPSLDGPWQGKDAHNGPFPLVPHQLYPPRWDNWIQNP